MILLRLYIYSFFTFYAGTIIGEATEPKIETTTRPPTMFKTTTTQAPSTASSATLFTGTNAAPPTGATTALNTGQLISENAVLNLL